MSTKKLSRTPKRLYSEFKTVFMIDFNQRKIYISNNIYYYYMIELV